MILEVPRVTVGEDGWSSWFVSRWVEAVWPGRLSGSGHRSGGWSMVCSRFAERAWCNTSCPLPRCGGESDHRRVRGARERVDRAGSRLRRERPGRLATAVSLVYEWTATAVGVRPYPDLGRASRRPAPGTSTTLTMRCLCCDPCAAPCRGAIASRRHDRGHHSCVAGSSGWEGASWDRLRPRRASRHRQVLADPGH